MSKIVINAIEAQKIAARVAIDALETVVEHIKQSATKGDYQVAVNIDPKYCLFIVESLEREDYKVVQFANERKLIISWEIDY